MFNTGQIYGRRLCWNWLRRRAWPPTGPAVFIAACPILAGIAVGLFFHFVIIPVVAWIIARFFGLKMSRSQAEIWQNPRLGLHWSNQKSSGFRLHVRHDEFFREAPSISSLPPLKKSIPPEARRREPASWGPIKNRGHALAARLPWMGPNSRRIQNSFPILSSETSSGNYRLPGGKARDSRPAIPSA